MISSWGFPWKESQSDGSNNTYQIMNTWLLNHRQKIKVIIEICLFSEIFKQQVVNKQDAVN